MGYAARPLSGGTTTTSVACYLQKGSDVTWQWGLNADNSYDKLNGYWITTSHTSLQKFVTDTDEAEMMAAANRGIAYYNRAGYSVIGLFGRRQLGGLQLSDPRRRVGGLSDAVRVRDRRPLFDTRSAGLAFHG